MMLKTLNIVTYFVTASAIISFLLSFWYSQNNDVENTDKYILICYFSLLILLIIFILEQIIPKHLAVKRIKKSPSDFSKLFKLFIFLTTIRNPWIILRDIYHGNIVEIVLYKSWAGLKFFSRSRTTDINEGVVVLSGYEYPIEILDIVSKKQPIIIDCGANIGFFSMYVKNKCPNARIFAIEPLPLNIELLERNLKQNSFNDIEILPFAVSHDGRDCEFSFTEGHYDGGTIVPTNKKGNGYSQILKTITLESVILDYKIDCVDVLKMDIEGGEYEVLAASTRILSNCVKTFVIEYHTNVMEDGRNYIVNIMTKNREFELFYETNNLLGFRNMNIACKN